MKFEKDTKEIVKMSVLLVFMIIAGFGFLFPKSNITNISADSGAENDRIIREGVMAARKKGKFGESCASCHSPDLIELAVYDFSDDNLRRRARAHVSGEDTEKIVAMIRAERETYNLTNLLNPLTDRPLQPAGNVLQGATTLEKDSAFGEILLEKLPTLAAGKIETEAEALKARDELLAVDLRDLSVGIEFPRLSEDNFHGAKHGSLNDWIADLPRPAKSERAEAAFYAVSDEYLQNPSRENLWRLYDAVETDTKSFNELPAGEFAKQKYLSLLILQHLYREKLSLQSNKLMTGATAFDYLKKDDLPNPLWNFGSLAAAWRKFRVPFVGVKFDISERDAPRHVKTLGFPEMTTEKLDSSISGREAMNEIGLSWMYLGFMLDPSLERTNDDYSYGVFKRKNQPDKADDLYELLRGQFPLHNAFVASLKVVSKQKDFDADYGKFADKNNSLESKTPMSAGHRKLYQTFVANSYRMSLFLLERQKRSNTNSLVKSKLNLKEVKRFLNEAETDSSIADLLSKLK